MSEFKYMKKPVKPREPSKRHDLIIESEGWYVEEMSFSEIEEAVAEYRKNNEDILDRIEIVLGIEDGWEAYDRKIVIEARISVSQADLDKFDDAMAKYNKDYRAWEKWRKDNKKEIEAHKANEKKERALRKMKKEADTLRKKLEALESEM